VESNILLEVIKKWYSWNSSDI